MMEQKNAVKTGDVAKAAREENKDGNNSRIVIAGKGGVGKHPCRGFGPAFRR